MQINLPTMNTINFHVIVEYSAALSMAVALFIETSSWWIKSMCPERQMGRYISRTNIYLYTSRFFVVAFQSSIAFFIEAGESKKSVASILTLTFLFCGIIQFIILNKSKLTEYSTRYLAYAIGLRDTMPLRIPGALAPRSRRIGYITCLISLVFGLGAGIPLMAAALFPAHRLSISYIGQVLNSLGTLLTLFYVDQALYRAMDQGHLMDDILGFTFGRIAGVLLAAACFLVVWLLV